jgi:hypothetical protein
VEVEVALDLFSYMGLCGAACRVTLAFQRGNNVSDKGATALAESLKTNYRLLELHLVSEGSREVWWRLRWRWLWI